jgi:hypothetical protein
LPSAVKIGQGWTFNLAAPRAFVRDQEHKAADRCEALMGLMVRHHDLSADS